MTGTPEPPTEKPSQSHIDAASVPSTDSGSVAGRGIDMPKVETAVPAEGAWPSWRIRLWQQDLRRGTNAPGADGIKSPTFATPAWLSGNDCVVVQATAKEMMEGASDRLASGEKRAAGVFDAAWKLLAIALATTGFEATRLRSSGVPLLASAVLLIPNVCAVVALCLAALEGMTASSRVGLTWGLEIEDIAKADKPVAAQAVDYWHAAQTIDWVARKKLDDFLLAQAWLSRGIVALVIGAVVAIGVWTVTADASPASTTISVQDPSGMTITVETTPSGTASSAPQTTASVPSPTGDGGAVPSTPGTTQ